MDWFKSERQKRRTPIHHAQLRSTPTLPGFDARSRELYGTALPRGVLPAAAVRLEHCDVEMIRAACKQPCRHRACSGRTAA